MNRDANRNAPPLPASRVNGSAGSSAPPQEHSQPGAYGSRPCYPELVAVIGLGALHVASEVAFSLAAARAVNGAVVACVAAYLVWRAGSAPGVLRGWGLRRDNFWPSLRAQLALAVPAAAVLLGVGLILGTAALPATFWLTLLLYPLWGIAQQFALQNLLMRNLSELLPRDLMRAAVAAALFGLSHVPRMPLALLAAVAGFGLTLIYRRYPNLWAAGCVHGALGALVFYLVLQQDPGAKILETLGRVLPGVLG